MISIKLFKVVPNVGNPPLCSGVIPVSSGPKSHTFTVILAVFAPQPRCRCKPWRGLLLSDSDVNAKIITRRFWRNHNRWTLFVIPILYHAPNSTHDSCDNLVCWSSMANEWVEISARAKLPIIQNYDEQLACVNLWAWISWITNAKITHRVQRNPMKSDSMTENMHRNISGTAENESDLKQITNTWPIIQTSDITLVSLLWRCFRLSRYLIIDTPAIYGAPSVTKVFKIKYRLYHRVCDVLCYENYVYIRIYSLRWGKCSLEIWPHISVTWNSICCYNLKCIGCNYRFVHLAGNIRGRRACHDTVPRESDAMLWNNHRWESIITEGACFQYFGNPR